MFSVRNISVEDFTFAVNLTDTMDWNLAEDDFEFMTELEPDGCFIVLDDSERIGLATTISFGRVGWLGNVIVSENHRERGAGSLLVRHCIEYLTKKRVETIGLYSYIERTPFYRRLGFEYESEFIVLKGKGFSAPTKTSLKRARKEDLQEIVNLDHLCFGTSRMKLLKPILLKPNNLCYMHVEDGRLLGFVVGKVYDRAAEVGPLVCQQGRSDIAIGLLTTVLNKLEGLKVSMCIPERESTILDTLMRFGFSQAFRVARMFYGRPVVKDCIYIAESLERG